MLQVMSCAMTLNHILESNGKATMVGDKSMYLYLLIAKRLLTCLQQVLVIQMSIVLLRMTIIRPMQVDLAVINGLIILLKFLQNFLIVGWLLEKARSVIEDLGKEITERPFCILDMVKMEQMALVSMKLEFMLPH